MTSDEFVIWMKGFMEACNDFTATPKQWDRIREVLYNVEDYEDNPGLDVEIDDWYPDYPLLSGSIKIGHGGVLTLTSGSSSTETTIWSDQRGNWHYTNNPEGFGYLDNSQDKLKKQQLND